MKWLFHYESAPVKKCDVFRVSHLSLECQRGHAPLECIIDDRNFVEVYYYMRSVFEASLLCCSDHFILLLLYIYYLKGLNNRFNSQVCLTGYGVTLNSPPAVSAGFGGRCSDWICGISINTESITAGTADGRRTVLCHRRRCTTTVLLIVMCLIIIDYGLSSLEAFVSYDHQIGTWMSLCW